MKDVKTMREILFKNQTSLKNRRRVICVSEKAESKEVTTRVHKVFIYVVGREVEAVEDIPAPVFSIIKHFNTKTKEEKFAFRVKGMFYVVQDSGYLVIHFCHSLRIDVARKSKISAS